MRAATTRGERQPIIGVQAAAPPPTPSLRCGDTRPPPGLDAHMRRNLKWREENIYAIFQSDTQKLVTIML